MLDRTAAGKTMERLSRQAARESSRCGWDAISPLRRLLLDWQEIRRIEDQPVELSGGREMKGAVAVEREGSHVAPRTIKCEGFKLGKWNLMRNAEARRRRDYELFSAPPRLCVSITWVSVI